MPPQNTETVRTHINLGEFAREGTVAARDRQSDAGVNTPLDQRRYVITAGHFVCGDESGADWSGSDEVQWTFTTKFEGEEPVTHASREFGDVDSGDEREYTDNDGDIAPSRSDLSDSVAAPVGVSIQLIEVDQGEDHQSTVERTFQAAALIPSVGVWVSQTPDIVKNQLVEMLDDDLMGSTTIAFRARDLERRLPTVGSTFVEKIYFGGQGGDLPFAVAGGPDYYLYVKVERVQDAD